MMIVVPLEFTVCKAFYPVVRIGELVLATPSPARGGDTLACGGAQFRRWDSHSGTLGILQSLYGGTYLYYAVFFPLFGLLYFKKSLKLYIVFTLCGFGPGSSPSLTPEPGSEMEKKVRIRDKHPESYS